MKYHSVIAFLLLLVLVGGCPAPRQQKTIDRGYATDLDFTTPTDFSVESFDGRQPLREFGTNNAPGFSDNYIFGRYRATMEILAGNYYYFFPDGCFVIEEFIDVGPSSTIATGRCRLDGNVVSILDLAERKDAALVHGMKWIKEHLGPIERFRLFVTADGESIGDTILVPEDTAKKSTHIEWNYIQRMESYKDWPKEQQRLLKK